jgi:hypothetical protein
MDPDALREQLLKLHAELGAAHSVDPQSNRLLGDLMEDIKRLMQQPTDPAAAPAAPQSLPDRLENIAVQFEADHPALAASSRRLVDLLAKAGL